MNNAPPAFTEWRRALLAKAHIGKKRLSLDDDTWRDLLQQKFGVRSSGDLDVTQLGQLVEHLKSLGFRDSHPVARRKLATVNDVSRETIRGGNAEIVGKIRAQWVALYHLGLVKDPSDTAILSFAKRQTKKGSADGSGVQALKWITAQQGFLVIEALKVMGTRAGVIWTEHKNPRVCVLMAQARRCVELGIFQSPQQIHVRAAKYFSRTKWENLDGGEMDKLTAILGSEIRGRLAETAP